MSEFDTMNNGASYHGPANQDDYQPAAGSARFNPYTGEPMSDSAQASAGAPREEQEQPRNDPPRPRKPKKQKNGIRMTAGKVVALGLCCALVGGASGAGGVLFLANTIGKNDVVDEEEAEEENAENTTEIVESSRNAAVNTVSYDASEEMTAAQIYEANVNSCVGISVNVTYNYWGYTTTGAASGSGFVLTSDGYIVTNYHVVEDADSDSITVTTYDGNEYDATLIGYDSDNDVAVLKIDATGLTPVVLGSSSDLNVGDDVVAIGNPLGELTFTMTSGIVSALDREVTTSYGTQSLIQTDCAINSGNSGGPLFDMYGELIGITNAKYSSSSSSSEASIDNIGFAIPIDNVKNIITSIIEKGYVEKAYLGVSLQNYSYTDADGNAATAPMVYSVVSGEAADTAGLTRGDLITSIDGQAMTSYTDVSNYISSCEPGDTIEIVIDRNGETMTISATLGSQVSTEESSSSSEDTQQSSGSGYGYGGSNGGFGFGFGNGSMG